MNIVTRNYIDISDFKFVELKKILNYAKKIKRNPKKFNFLYRKDRYQFQRILVTNFF